MNCPSCQVTKLVTVNFNFKRKHTTIGNFCLRCLQFQTFDKGFDKLRDKLVRENQNTKPKFSKLKKQRRTCTDCMKKGIVNRQKWKLKKVIVKKNESPHWKGTCQKCGGVWGQNTSKEYDLIDPNQINYSLGL